MTSNISIRERRALERVASVSEAQQRRRHGWRLKSQKLQRETEEAARFINVLRALLDLDPYPSTTPRPAKKP